MEPIAEDRGIRSLTVSTDGQSETVTASDLPAFEVPPSVEEDLGESPSVVVLRPVSVSFAEGNKWRFTDGESTFFAGIEDARFAQAVEEGSERFAKNDMLRVRLRVRQTRRADGLHTDRAVLEVINHISGNTGVQLALFSGLGDEADEGRGDEDQGEDGSA